MYLESDPFAENSDIGFHLLKCASKPVTHQNSYYCDSRSSKIQAVWDGFRDTVNLTPCDWHSVYLIYLP